MNKYFIFPLSVISDMSEENFKNKLNEIIGYSVINYSFLLNDISQSKAKQLKKRNKNYIDCNSMFYNLNKILSSRENLGIIDGSLRFDISRYEGLNEIDHNKIKVSLHKELIFDIRDNSILNCDEFKVLCSIYSVLGNGFFKLIRLEVIKRRFSGYIKKEEALNKDLISTKRLNTIIKRLIKRNFFYRITFNSRFTYYGYHFKFEDEAKFIETVKSKIIERRQPIFKKIKFEVKKIETAKILEMYEDKTDIYGIKSGVN